MTRKGRTVALSAAVLSLGTLAAAGIAKREALREWWWIHELGSGDAARRLEAAGKLAAMRSARAAPRLIALIRADEREGIGTRLVPWHHQEGQPSRRRLRIATPLVHALYEIGEGALPAVRAALDAEREDTAEGLRLKRLLRELLERSEPPRKVPLRPEAFTCEY